jgi:hypothetical protein
MADFVFNAPPTISDYMNCSAMVKCIVGPVGSGKTTGVIFDLLKYCTLQEPDRDGVRRSRVAVVRNTREAIRTTVLKDIELLLAPIIRYKVYNNTVFVRFPLPDGTSVDSEWLMIPLETKEDQRRLLSLQLTFAWYNECREIDFALVGPTLGRLGRFPSKTQGPGATHYGLFLDSNPWSEASDWHQAFVREPVPGWELFIQPGGLYWPGLEPNLNAENIENLPPDYYNNLIKGQPREFIKVAACGLWGEDMSGQVVWRDSFATHTHVAEGEIIPTPTYPLIVGLDLGRQPTAVICQNDTLGRFNVLDEVISEGMGLETFCAELLVPRLQTPRFGSNPAIVVFDPAGISKSQYTDHSAPSVLRDAGLAYAPATTNNIEPRLMAVEHLLLRMVRGDPTFQIDPRCDMLIRTMSHEYKYKRMKTGELQDIPDKTHPWSDIADALQYACLGHSQNVVARHIARSRQMEMAAHRPRITAAGWT